MAMPTQTEEAKITILDIRMAVAVLGLLPREYNLQ